MKRHVNSANNLNYIHAYNSDLLVMTCYNENSIILYNSNNLSVFGYNKAMSVGKGPIRTELLSINSKKYLLVSYFKSSSLGLFEITENSLLHKWNIQ